MNAPSNRLIEWWSGRANRRAFGQVAVVFLLVGSVYSTLPMDVVDLRADWLVTNAAVDGLDPHVPIPELAARYGSPLAWTWVHPRTPGALVLQLPILLLSEAGLRWLSAWSAAVLVPLLVLASTRFVPVDRRWILPAMVLVAVIGPSIQNVFTGAQSLVVALLLVYAWSVHRERDGIPGGVALGVAITLKVFPWALLPILVVYRRKRVLAAAIVTGPVLNAGGPLFAGVTIQSASSAILRATSHLASDRNGSLLALIDWSMTPGWTVAVVAAGAAAIAWVARRSRSFDGAMAVGMVLGLCFSPLVWAHYLLVLVPVILWAFNTGSVLIRAALGGLTALWLVPDPVWMARTTIPISLVALAVITLYASQRPTRIGSIAGASIH